MVLPHPKSDVRMNPSMQWYFGMGSNRYGLTSCAGVCCAINLTQKSMSSTKGNTPVITSKLVNRLESLAAKAIITANIRIYTSMSDPKMPTIHLAALLASYIGSRRLPSFRCRYKSRKICKEVRLVMDVRVISSETRVYRRSITSAEGNSLALNVNVLSAICCVLKFMMVMVVHCCPSRILMVLGL